MSYRRAPATTKVKLRSGPKTIMRTGWIESGPSGLRVSSCMWWRSLERYPLSSLSSPQEIEYGEGEESPSTAYHTIQHFRCVFRVDEEPWISTLCNVVDTEALRSWLAMISRFSENVNGLAGSSLSYCLGKTVESSAIQKPAEIDPPEQTSSEKAQGVERSKTVPRSPAIRNWSVSRAACQNGSC